MEKLKHLTDLTNLPLSFNQNRLWIIFQQDKQNPAYNLSVSYQLKGNINVDIFRKSLEILFYRQHTMFSVFKQKGGEPFIEIIPKPVTLKEIDFSQFSAVDSKREILSYLGKDLRKSIDIEKGPLYRLFLLKYDEASYYFHATIHHIIFDGNSNKLFVEELSSIYNNLIGYSAEGPGPLEYQSYDFAALEKESESVKDEKVSIEFWKEYLKDSPPELKFPYDFPRKLIPSGMGSKMALLISDDVTGKLKKLSGKTNTSLFKTLMAVLGLLFQKYSGEDDICIGFPVSTRRMHPYLEKIFGMYVNTSVARLKIQEESTFEEFVISTREAVNKAIDNSNLPFETIVNVLNPERSPNMNPVFQVAFSWVSKMFPEMDLNGSGNERIHLVEGVSSFDISFYLWEEESHIRGEIEFNIDILKCETVLRLKNNFVHLLEILTNNPEATLDSIPLITEEETKQVLAFTDTIRDFPGDKTIAELFDEQVKLHPEKTAVVFKGESLTYKQLDERSDKLACTLQDHGVRRNTSVGILAEKSSEMILGILGILKAGGAYVPVAPDYPEQRMNFIIRDSGCRVLVTQDKFLQLNIDDVTKISLNSKETFNSENRIIKNINSPNDLAYIMYTSGTTGMPKGTPITQQGVVRLVRNTNYIDLTSQDRIIQAGAIVFDATIFEIWGALLNGCSLYVIEKETLLDHKLFGEELVKNEITTLLLTSSLFTQLAETGTRIFHKLKYLLVGGDVLSPAHINKVRKDNPQLIVINIYGPTENSCISTFYKIDRDFDSNIPIGKPISNSTAYIFDKNMNFQPVGVIGELYVGGPGLSTGYINKEDLNKISFISHPYIPGERIYKTGDYARWLSDGNIEFHGRVDNQLKIRGFRVELEEIESVISKLDGVNETVIKPVKVEEGDYRLIAFLNVSESFRKDAKEVKNLLKSSLPSYMVPSAYRFMHGFPKTINGKTDRKALDFDLKDLEKAKKEDVKTLTPTQNLILKIWSEALKTYNISLTDSFFDLGGNSLLAISLINNIKEQTGFSMTFKELLIYPTVIQSGDFIDSQVKGKNKQIEMIHLNETLNLPLTRNQKKLWVLSKVQPDIPSYIIGLSYKLTGSLNREVFQKSLDFLFHRHNILFSVIKEIDGEPFCDILSSKVEITFIDYSQLPENEKEKKVLDFIKSDSLKVFDLKNGPLYRLYLIITSSNEYYFHASIHHIIFDGWSWSLFVKDLNEIYNSLLQDKRIDLEDLDFQQYDYAHWEETSESSRDDKELTEFWKEYLEGASPILNFPYDYQRKELQSGIGRYEIFSISQDISDKLRNISKTEGTSLFTTLLGIFGILMHKYSGEDDINIGLPVAYRPHTKLETIFGMFVNTVVVRLVYSKNLTFREILHSVNDAAMNVIAHQDLTFDRVVEVVNPKRYPNVNPLFQVSFAWQNNLEKPLKLDGLIGEKISVNERTIPFDLIISLWENGTVIEGEFGYSTDLLKEETIVRLKHSFLNLVNVLIENSDKSIGSLSVMTDEIVHYLNFPVADNGKVNAKALFSDYQRSVDSAKESSGGGTVEEIITLTSTQKVMRNIWTEVLNRTDISAQDSFFDVGGNSLLAFKLINNIKEHTGFEFSFKELISNPSVIQAGNYIDCQHLRTTNTLKLTHSADLMNLPLTRNQKRLWLIFKLHPDLPSYIIGFSYKLSGPLNREVFQKSLDFLFHRHHIVFSVIKEINSEPYCDIVPSKAELTFFDYSKLPDNEKDSKVKDIIVSESGKVFDMKNGPLYRLYLIKTSTDEYYFHFSIHHILFDGWSWTVFVNDLKEIYGSLSAGKEIDLGKIEFQQYDYARLEESSESLKNENESIEFWKENLKGASTMLNLPFDFQRKDRPSDKGRYEKISIPRDLSEKIKIICKTEGSSLFTTLMAVFGIQMHKYSGEDDINIGVPIAYRPHSKLENIFGMFVNTIVVRLRYKKDFTFRNIISQTNEAALNAIAHQNITFEKVVEIVNPERSSNINPLFQVAFAWQNNLDASLKLDGIRSEKVEIKDRINPFDILLSLWENGPVIEGEIDYSPDLFNHETIIRLRDNFLTLIKNLVENPEKSVESIPMISDEERNKIMGFTGTITNYPKDQTIVQLFEEQVELFPDKTAVVFNGDSITYNQLNERTNKLAGTLRKSGIINNTPVAILAEKSLDMIVGILGILKAGGCYVPIDPEYPERRINYILKDSECRILLSQDKFMMLPFEGVKILNMNSPDSYAHNKSNPDNFNDSSSLAYIMYTSGTTGNPKGSMILHKGVTRLVKNTNYITLSAADRILLTGALVFDASTFEIWGALLNGGTLYMVDKQTILDPKALGEALKKDEITVLWLTSALFTHIAELRTDIFKYLKYLLVGGDILSAAHINKVRNDNPSLKVINGYGPTENTTFSTTFLIDRDYDNNIPIGKPISNSSAYIFDRNMNYQPVGVTGELYVGGDGLSKGYINRDDLNQKSFIAHPNKSGETIYRTGDYARWLPDGNIEFHGRADNQLKINGFRVEIGEIEAVISEIEGVIETVVKPIKIEEGDKRLVAFLNVSDTFGTDTKQLMQRIKEKLPPYMIPAMVKILNGFPKTINGKTDKNALTFDINDSFNRDNQELKTLTQTEMKIHDIWCEVLKTKDILPTDNFFEIGGNSLLAISIMSKIESIFNVELGLRVFFDSPKIKDLAEAIDLSKNKKIETKSYDLPKDNKFQIVNGEI